MGQTDPMRYVVLLRGINVGGRNKVPMAGLRAALERDFTEVRTYIQSGNAIVESDRTAAQVAAHVEELLPREFSLDSALVRALVLDPAAYGEVLSGAPRGFGKEPDTYRYDVGFYLGVTGDEVAPHLPVNPEVDTVTFGERAFYHRRLIEKASRSRLSKVIGSPVYPSLTIRNWRTTTTLGDWLLDDELQS
jgi:uncharacterized protein (DUF1697 family)